MKLRSEKKERDCLHFYKQQKPGRVFLLNLDVLKNENDHKFGVVTATVNIYVFCSLMTCENYHKLLCGYNP